MSYVSQNLTFTVHIMCHYNPVIFFTFFFSVPTMAFDPIPQTVQVKPTSKSGSTVATLKLWVDEAILNSSASLRISKYAGLVLHNNSDQIMPRFISHIQSLLEMSPSEDPSISSTFYLNLDDVTLSRLIGSSMEQCIASSAKRYIAISLDLRLLNDSLYHLGDHSILMGAYLRTPNNTYTFHTILKLTVEAGLISLYLCHSHFLSHANLHTCTC